MLDGVKDGSARLKIIYEEFPKILKSVGTLGSLFGFAYLFSYTRYAGIPFPLELTVLPSTLLLVGTMALFATAIVFGSVLYPIFLSGDDSLITNVILRARDVDIKKRASTGYLRYALCYWWPMALTLAGLLLFGKVFDYGAAAVYWETACFVIALGLILGTAWFFPIPNGKHLEYVGTVVGQVVFSVIANFMGVLIAVALIPELGDWDIKAGFLIVLLGFTFIHISVSMPNYHIEKYEILLPPYFEPKRKPKQILAIVILFFFVLVSVLAYPVNAKIGKTVLANFGVGGEIPVSICLKDVPAISITQRISFGPDKCSEKLALLLDAGDRVYVVKPAPDGQARPTSLVSTPIYFRQDQLLQKVYLPIPKAGRKLEKAK